MEDMPPPEPMPTLAEDDEGSELRGATFGIPLDRMATVDTMPESSSANLIPMPRPPELHHEDRRSGDGHSMDSAGSEAELIAAHQRGVSADPRGEAPSYAEAVSTERGLTTISLNDPAPNNISSNAIAPPPQAASRGRLRFSFQMPRPFGSHNHANGGPSNVNPSPNQSPPSIRPESPAPHGRSGSALSRFSTRESHDSHHSRTPSRGINHSRSNSNLLRALRSHSPGLQAGSSTISVDSISAPLTHTLTRAEFYAPKGGLLTPEQVKLITSREALERFGVPYGPDAVAAFSLSRERLSGMEAPPPDFESVTGEQERSGASGSGSSATDLTAPGSTSLTQPASSHLAVERAGSRTSTVMSYATAPESNGNVPRVQIVQTYASEDEDDDGPDTTRPMTPRTARSVSE